jgi:hypothetical protein
MSKQTGKVMAWFVMGAFLLGAGCAVNQPALGQKGPLTGSKPPVITGYYSPEKGRYGDVLKIYIVAEDPDGDMLRIATQVSQVGIGTYPTHWLYLKGEHRQRFIGYLQWNTFNSRGKNLSEWTRISINISLFDSAGNESNRIVIPYEFVSEAISPPSLPAPFDQSGIPRLGYITVELTDPTRTEKLF